MRRVRLKGLWRHPDFLKLWIAQTISVFGNQISYVAIPLLAILILDASVVEMGILTAAGRMPWLLVGLFAGVWVDRLRRRPVLIVADFLRAMLLGLLALLAFTDLLSIELMVTIAFLVGVLGVFFDVAYFSYLPTLIGRSQLVDGNSKLAVSDNVAGIAGPSIAGVLVQIFTASVAIFIDAVSFALSGLMLGFIEADEPEPGTARDSRRMRAEIGEGLRFVASHSVIRSIVAGGAVHNFFTNMLMAVFVLYLTHSLGFDPATIGLIFGVFSAGALLGALAAKPVAQLLGIGPSTLIGQFGTATAGLLIPLAAAAPSMALGMILVGQFIWAFTRPIMNINLTSLMAGVTPDAMMGRMTASRRFMMWGVMPLGGLAGGFLGSAIGLQATLFVVIAGEVVSGLVYLFSPLRGIREQPEAAALSPNLS